MPGPVLVQPKDSSVSQIAPDWLKPENASVFDPPWRSGMRAAVQLVGWLTGANDPQAALLGAAGGALEAPNSEVSLAMQKVAEKFPRLAKALKAYHGSPHDFDKFEASKIGTGEGAAAYGHGLYFAENPEVAADYRRALAKPSPENPLWRYKGDPVAVGTEHWPLARALDLAGPKPENEPVAEYLAKRIGEIEKHGEYVDKAYGGDAGSMYRHNAETLKKIDPTQLEYVKPGRTYEVALHADPEHLLDWDKPLEQQSAHVQQALGSIGVKPDPIGWNWQPHQVTAEDVAAKTFGPSAEPGQWTVAQKDATGKIQYHSGQFYQSEWRAAENAAARQAVSQTSPRDKGEALYRDLQSRLGGGGTASQQLQAAGIPGIKYLDQGSRLWGTAADMVTKYGSREKALEVAQQRLRQASFGSTGDMAYWDNVVQKLQTPETRNFVVFPGSEQLVEILKKYGLLLPSSGLLLQQALKDQPPPQQP